MDRETSRAELAHARRLLALTATYVVMGRFGLALSPVAGFAALVWPPTAIALVALTIGGYRLWPGVALGAFLANLWAGAPPVIALGMAVGNTLEAVVGAFALRRIEGFRGSIDTVREVISLVVVVGVASTVISATVGTMSLVLGRQLAPGDVPRTWGAWWMGDFMAVILLAPVLFTWARGLGDGARPRRLAEVGALAALLAAVSFLVLAERPQAVAQTAMLRPSMLPTLLFVPLIWAALRFGTRGASTATLAVAAVAIWGTYTGHGAFVRADRTDGLIALHVFLIATAVPSLLLGAAVCELEQSREKARAREATLRTVIEGTTDCVFFKDRRGRYVVMNAACARTLGGPAPEVLGKDDAALRPPDEAARLREDDQGVMRAGTPRTIEETLTFGGRPRVFQTTKAPYRDPEGRVLGVIGIARDVTEQKRLVTERAELLEREQAALAQARVASRAKDEFLAMLSHELRTPLQAVLGWTQVLEPRVQGDDALRKGLATIERNARVQAQLIEDLLDISRIVTGKLHVDRRRVDLRDVVTEAIESVRSAADAKSIGLCPAIDPATCFVLGDPVRLQQVVVNLLTNAVKFTPSGGRIGVQLHRGRAAAEIVVRDSGRGISPDFLPHVFERFRQAESGTARGHGGLGLGLAIVHHLTELHGGAVTAESPGEGLGATFTVTLPTLGDDPGRAAVDLRKDDAADILDVLGGVRVLVVDDEADARDMLAMVLGEAGAEVHAVPSVRAALGEIASFSPDLLLSDIGMPEEDGYALIREVRAGESTRGAHLPAIALTASATAADREAALSRGFDVHLAKPADLKGLAHLAASLVGRAP